MNHVNLDTENEVVRRFVLSLAIDPAGTVLETNGKPIACVVPPPKSTGIAPAESWTNAKNQRRCALIDKKYESVLSSAEEAELNLLQDEAIRYRRRVAPLPLDYARELHQRLVELAASKQSS